MKKRKFRTDFLFSTPNFLTGAGTAMNLGGNYYEFNVSESAFEADRLALKNDWNVIGEDIEEALRQTKKDNKLIYSK